MVWYRGLAALVTGDFEGAALAFDAVYDAFPGEAAPKLALGACAEVLGQLDNAADYYHLVWTTDPSYVSAAFGLARVRLAAGDRQGAVRALESVPESSIHYTAARVAADPDEDLTVAAEPGDERTALCVPLATGGRHYGVLVCARDSAPCTAPEAEFLRFLTERAASHIRHAREHDAVSSIIGKLQRALLAEPGRPHPNLDVAIRYLPVGHSALVGGDWCETVRLHFGRTLLVVGDVMGHGLEAAVDMTAYRSSLRYIASADLPPHRVLRQLDDMASDEPERRPATCLLAQIDPNRGLVTLASAGHLPPFVIDADGRATPLPVPVGPPLGTGLGGYEPATFRMAPGQTLILFTDGLVERRGEDIDRSLDRLGAIDFGTSPGLDDILDTVVTRLDARNTEDDVAALAARLRSRPRPG